MSDKLRQTIYQALADIRLIDPHTHINPHAPASSTLADLLGYHYYTELAHSAGMRREAIEEPGLLPREQVARLVPGLGPLENTIQYSWLIDICRRFFDFEGQRLDDSNWEAVYDAAEQKMQFAEWPDTVLQQSNVEAVFLTNDFDDSLAGFDPRKYIPCLRTDDLVFHLARPEVRERLTACSGIEVSDLSSLRAALEQRFEHFVSHGARACAISLPPGFTPHRIADGRAATALDDVLQAGPSALAAQRDALSRRVFWTLAELCDHHGLPFDLMIGVNRGVYPNGVFQGQDLYDSRVSLIQYQELFNAFPNVKFPISVLASVTNQELVSYAWIFPNVITNGHWWYSNTPSFIERDAAARLEAVPQTKQIGYYSDAYKLEFVAPKFDMYRRILAKVLSESFVVDRGWSEEQAIELGRKVLRGNVESIFPELQSARADDVDTIDDDALDVDEPSSPTALGIASAAVVAPALGDVAGVFMEQASQSTESTVDDESARDTPVAFDEQLEVADEQDDAGLWGVDETDDGAETNDVDETDDGAQPDDPQADTPAFPVSLTETVDSESASDLTVAFDEQLEAADEQDDAGLWGVDATADTTEPDTTEPDTTEPDTTEPEDQPIAPPAFSENLAETVDSDPASDLTVDFEAQPDAGDEPDAASEPVDQDSWNDFQTVEMDEFPTVVEEPAPPKAEPQPLVDIELEAADEQDDAELWDRDGGDSDHEDDGESLTLMEDLPTTVEDAAPTPGPDGIGLLIDEVSEKLDDAAEALENVDSDLVDDNPEGLTDVADDEPADPPSLAFDQELEDADEEDDAMLWSDDDDDGDLTLEAPPQEPSSTPLPTLEEYQPLSDSGTSLMGEEDNSDSSFGQLSDGSSLTDDEEDKDADK